MKNFKLISLLSLVLLFSLSSNIFCMKRKRVTDKRDTQEQDRLRKKRKLEELSLLKRRERMKKYKPTSQCAQHLAFGPSNGAINIFEKKVKTIGKHTGCVMSVAFSPDGRYFASGSRDKTIKIFDRYDDWKVVKTIKHKYAVKSVAFSPDSQYLASGYADGTIKIFNTINWEEVKTIGKIESYVNSVVFSPHGKYLAFGFRDGTIKIFDTKNSWDPEYWKIVKTRVPIFSDYSRLPQADPVKSVVFSSDGQYLAFAGSYDGKIKILILGGDKKWGRFKSIQHTNPATPVSLLNYVELVAFSSDGQYFASGSCDGTIKIFDIKELDPEDWQVVKTIGIRGGLVKSVAFDTDSQYFAYGSSDGTIKILDTKDWKEVETIEHESSILSVAFQPGSGFHLENLDLRDKKLELFEEIKIM